MKRPVTLFGLAFILAAVVAGCGQKGPLYLPDEARDVVTRPAPTAGQGAPDSPDTPPTPDEEEDEDKNGKPPR